MGSRMRSSYDTLANCSGGAHPRHLGTDGERIDDVAERPAQGDVQAGDRRDDLEWVAVGQDYVRIRVGREQRPEARQVRWGLQDPALARTPPLQVLEELPVTAIRRREVLLLEPFLVRRNEP